MFLFIYMWSLDWDPMVTIFGCECFCFTRFFCSSTFGWNKGTNHLSDRLSRFTRVSNRQIRQCSLWRGPNLNTRLFMFVFLWFPFGKHQLQLLQRRLVWNIHPSTHQLGTEESSICFLPGGPQSSLVRTKYILCKKLTARKMGQAAENLCVLSEADHAVWPETTFSFPDLPCIHTWRPIEKQSGTAA